MTWSVVVVDPWALRCGSSGFQSGTSTSFTRPGAVRTEDDCKAWKAAYDATLAPLGRRVDMVIVLEMFSVNPAIAHTWVHYRRHTMGYARHCIRVESETDVFPTSPVKNVPKNELTTGAPTIADAMDLIDRLRRGVA